MSDEDPGQIERAVRWRLILGRFADEHLEHGPFAEDEEGARSAAGAESEPTSQQREARAIDGSLEFIYDREFAARAHRQPTAGESGGSSIAVPMWLNKVRYLFPEEAVRVIERDALTRYGMSELVTDPEILRTAEPSEELLKAILQFKEMMRGEVLRAARQMVARIVARLRNKLETQCRPALTGVSEPDGRPPQRTFRNTDWRRTIRRNLRHWDPEAGQLAAERIYFKHRQRARPGWRIIVAVDQSGSMLDSLITSSLMAAIFASLPSLECHLVLWDHRVVDVSDIAHDPLEVLMTCQLGGGTELLPALEYCAGLVREPERTILAVVSDWHLFGEQNECLRLAHELNEAGVKGIGLCALDERARGSYDERFARDLAGAGWFVAAMTPKKLAEHIGRIVG